MSDDREPFTCPRCGKQSWHPEDKTHGYCNACHDWTGDDAACELLECRAADPAECDDPECYGFGVTRA